MKHFDSKIATRFFCYACSLAFVFMPKIQGLNSYLILIGLMFFLFSEIESTTSGITKKITFINMLKNPFQSSFWANIYKFISLLFLFAAVIQLYIFKI